MSNERLVAALERVLGVTAQGGNPYAAWSDEEIMAAMDRWRRGEPIGNRSSPHGRGPGYAELTDEQLTARIAELKGRKAKET